MASVFISYSTTDSFFAELVKEKLKANNIKFWIDNVSLTPGEEWRNEIDLGISNSDVVLFIVSPESCASPYVTYEWAYALGKNKKVIPLLFRQAELHPRISVIQYLNFTNSGNSPWEKLYSLINQHSEEKTALTDSDKLVGKMTVEDLKAMMSGIISLANASANSDGRAVNESDIFKATSNFANANSSLNHQQTQSNYILWVDDNPDNNRYERQAFYALGIESDLAISTKEALRKLSTKKYDAVISDMGRAEGPMEGYVLLKELRRWDEKIPYFIYAGSNSPQHKQQAKEFGAQGTTNNPNELINMVVRHISNN